VPMQPEAYVARFDYDESDIHLSYDESRSLCRDTQTLWMKAICDHVPRESIASIADVGCGTGRFCRALSDHLSANVLGIEPSRKMLAVARRAILSPQVQLVQGRAERIPLGDGKVDMTYLSMVYHHLLDEGRAIAEIARVTRRHGFLCIRTATRESMDSYLWLDFFLRARQLEIERMPSREGLIACVGTGGLRLVAHTIVRQHFAASLQEYVGKISLRGVSSLRMLTDEEFREGLGLLKRYCDQNETGAPVYEEIDLFIFAVG
jgi:ubiquinone/menaquinone biosynthesis C-methylase UbiE